MRVRIGCQRRENGTLGSAVIRHSLLREIPCLRKLDPTVLDSLQAVAREKRLDRGEILFREGAVCTEVTAVLQGSVKIYRLSDDGRQQTLWVLGAGDCFCLGPFFHQVRYPATAQCMTEVRVLTTGREQCESLFRPDSEMASRVVRCLCDRLDALASLVEVVSTREVRRRVARVLVELARRRGISTGEGTLVDAGMTHDELAAFAGTAREVISRTLEQFQREGLLRLARRRLVIRDLPGLQAAFSPRNSEKKRIR